MKSIFYLNRRPWLFTFLLIIFWVICNILIGIALILAHQMEDYTQVPTPWPTLLSNLLTVFIVAPFVLGLVNSGFLIFIFLIRENHFELLQRTGWIYFLLAIPAIYAIYLVQKEQKTQRYTIFLGIFLAFLAIELLYDWILKIPFRETMDWKLLVPYLALYFSMNYGFVVMTWKYYSLPYGIILLVLFVIQIITNIVSHP